MNLNIPDDYRLVVCGEQIAKTDDLTEIRDLIQEIIDSDLRKIAINLSETTYINSLAIGLLSKLRKDVLVAEGDLIILEPSHNILTLFETIGLSRHFPIFSDQEELDSYLANQK